MSEHARRARRDDRAGAAPRRADARRRARAARRARRSGRGQRRRAAARRLSARIAAEGLADVSYAPVDSPFGTLLLAATQARPGARWRSPRRTSTRCSSASRARISPRIVEAPAPLDAVRRELDEYFDGRRRAFELPLDWTLVGPFGRRVLRRHRGDPLRRRAQLRARSPPRPAARAARARPATRSAPTRSRSSSPATACCAAAARSAATAAACERKRWLLELEGALAERALGRARRSALGRAGAARRRARPTAPRRGRPRACPRASGPRACRAGTTRRRARPGSRSRRR